jgi:hypothetical protein
MRRISRITAIVLLFLLGVSALFGACSLIFDLWGDTLKMPSDLLDFAPFEDYLIPGILLGIFNGILSLTIAILVILKIRLQALLIIIQGCVLMVWLTAEVIMKIYYPSITLPYYVLAILLIICGVLLFLKRSGSLETEKRTSGKVN